MVYTTPIVAALLAALPVNAGLYPKSSKVVQVDGKSYDRLIAQSNYTSVGPGSVESALDCTDPADR
jgi:protein disulfide-isomerase A6